MYKYFQPNKKDIKDKYGDCVIRSMCKALNKEWLEVFDEMNLIAREKQSLINNDEVYKEYLIKNGFKYHGFRIKRGHRRIMVSEFTEKIEKFTNDKNATCVINVSGHLLTSVGKHYYDTWNSGYCCMYGYWKRED